MVTKIKYILFFLMMPVLYLTQACIREDVGHGEGDDGDEIVLTVNYTVPGMATLDTRETIMSSTRENEVNAINVLVYEYNDVTSEEVLVYHRNAYDIQHSGTGGSFKVRLAKSKSGEKYTFDFIANNKMNIESTFKGSGSYGLIEYGDKREDVVREFRSTGGNGVHYSFAASSYLPMSAYSSTPVEITRNTVFNINLIRSFAMLDLFLNKDENGTIHGLDNFELASVHTYKGPNYGTFLYDKNKVSGTTVLEPTHTLVVGNNTGYGTRNTTDTHLIGGLVFFENNPVDIPSQEYAVIISGYYTSPAGVRSDRLYYYIRLHDPDNPTQLLKILRNHRISINILGIDGPGSSGSGVETSLSAAYNAGPINVRYDLTVYEEGYTNYIAFNDKYYLGVDNLHKFYKGDAGTGHFEVITNYKQAGWNVISVKDENDNVPTWLAITNGSGTAGSRQQATFTLDQNIQSPRMAYITFAAGELVIESTITQNGKFLIDTEYDGRLMKGDGDKYEVYVWGLVSSPLLIRAYSPDLEGVAGRDPEVSRERITVPISNLGEWNRFTEELEILGNAMVPNKRRQVQFQYSEDNGVTWVTFAEGPQEKGHYTLKETGRIVALYDYVDGNGKTEFFWSAAMGIDDKWDTTKEPFYYRSVSPLPDFSNIFLVTGNNRNALFYTPDIGFETGCADYWEEGYPRGNWRLPAVQELLEMHEYNQHIGDLAVYNEEYWSSTDQHVSGGTHPGSVVIFIRLDNVERWWSFFPRYNKASVRCVYGDPVVEVLEQTYGSWYYNPNNVLPGHDD